MSDNMDLKINLDVAVHELDQAKALRQEFELLEREITKMARDIQMAANPLASLARARGQLNAETVKGGRESLDIDRQIYGELKKQLSFRGRMRAQQSREESDAARQVQAEQRETARQFREQVQFNTRMARQRALAEAEAERETRREILETARMRDRETKKSIADAKALQRAQERAAAGVSRGAGQVRSGVGRAVTVGGATAGVVGYAARRGLDRLTRSGVDIDDAMAANARMETGLSPQDARAKIEGVRENYKPLARRLGQSVAELLRTRSESLQAGVDSSIVDSVVSDATKFAILNGLKPSDVAESSGYGLTALSAHGKVDAVRASRMFNTTQHLAQTTAASRAGLSAFVRRGLSAGAMAGFSDQDTLAYGAAGTAAGADGESVARALGSTQERLALAPMKAADIARKKHKTLHDRAFLALPRKLGFGSWRDLKAAYKADAAGVTEKLYEGIGNIQDPQQRLELSEMLWGKEFAPMHSAMAAGHLFKSMRESVRSPEAGTALDRGMAIQDQSFSMIMGQIGTTVTELMNDLGMELKPYYADLRDWALKTPKAFKSFTEAFRSGLKGFVTGLGSPDGTMAGLLTRMFGDPSGFSVNASMVGSFAQGVGQGLRDIGRAVASFVKLFAGQNASPQEIGRWTARLLGLSAALLVAAPAVAVMTGIGTAVAGMATGLLSTWRLLKGAGLIGAAAGTPRIAGIGAGPLPVQVIGVVSIAGWEIVTRMIEWFTGKNPGKGTAQLVDPGTGSALERPPMSVEPGQEGWLRRWWNGTGEYAKPMDRLTDSLDQTREVMREGAKVQKQAFQSIEGWRGLIHKAALTGPAGEIGDSIRSGATRAGSPLSGSVGAGEGGSPTGTRRYGNIGGSGGAQGAGGRAVSGAGNGTMPTSSTAGSLTDLINTEAARAGIDPRILHGIRAGESGKRADYDIKSDSKEDSYGPFQLNRRGGLGATFEKETGLDARDPKTIPAQTRWVAELIKKKGRGILRQRYGYKGDRDADPSWGNSGYVPNAPAGAGGSGTASGPVTPGQGGQSASRIQGQIDVEGTKFDFGSGGHKGANSIPFGTYPVTPDAIGPWGRANGALGINSNAIWDKTLGRMRTGIEFHAASNARMLTAGCIGIARDQYGAFKEKLLSVYRRSGRAFLTVGPNGASISADRPTDPTGRAVAAQERTKGLGQGAKPDLGGIDVSPQANPGQRAPIGANVPIRPSSGSGGGSAQGGGGGVTNHITVNAANHSPDEMAAAVQRKLNESMNRRSHDFDQAWA